MASNPVQPYRITSTEPPVNAPTAARSHVSGPGRLRCHQIAKHDSPTTAATLASTMSIASKSSTALYRGAVIPLDWSCT